jgi:hypothetical protein
MDDKKEGITCTRLEWPEMTHDEKDESQTGEERYLRQVSFQIKLH